MGKGRVDLNEKDINFLKFLYKHRYCNLKSINILYSSKTDTLYRRLKKLAEFDYISILKTKNIENLYSLGSRGYKTLTKIDPEKEYRKRNITERRLPFNVNHSLIIAEIGAMMNIRKFNYEVDLNLKAIFPEWKLIPDILIFSKIGFEVEIENKSMIKYAKKLSELQNTKEIEQLIYLSPAPQSLKFKIESNDEYKGGANLDERIILNETKQKINYIEIKDFIDNMDEHLNKFNLVSAERTL